MASYGQRRVHGFSGQVLGFEMANVLALGRARGLPDALMGEFLPDIETAMVAKLAEGRGSDG